MVLFTKESSAAAMMLQLSWSGSWIEYLHRGCDIQILHFDIKPHNILLDDNFTPKISDFGLAKFYSTEKATVTLTAARGTIGYVAPELINRNIGDVSYKADVYSFGMLLMEMLDLKRDIMADKDESSQYFPYGSTTTSIKVRTLRLKMLVKLTMIMMSMQGESPKKMTIVGLWCIQMSPVNRPSMSEVVKMLENGNENLQIPPRPSQSPQVAWNNDQTWKTMSTDSIALLGDHDASRDE
ncbi:UNVERIFIED_CONTAM: Rust resistance kinase Lr10 [Sesamum radiatum]|uniref:Rust resistance kinase Lr10 n=1 Tax=Sesamum radiatum TaxID=300843 RepID=A0AAW2IIW1_SESRA